MASRKTRKGKRKRHSEIEERYDNSPPDLNPPAEVDDADGEAGGSSKNATKRQEALELLLLHNPGLNPEKALLALNATNESASDVLFWIDKAQEWLAIDNECEDEAKKMGAAMQLSLQEKELRQAEEVPLAERSSEDVCAFFGGISDFFRILEASKELEQLKMLMDKALSLKTAILDYLEMEKLCKGWWSFSTGYFQDAAKEIQDNIREILGDNSQELKDNCTAIQSTGGPNAKGDLPALYIDSTLANAGVKNLEPLKALFAGRAQELKDNVYCRPEGNGNFIPKIFAAYVTQEGGYLSD